MAGKINFNNADSTPDYTLDMEPVSPSAAKIDQGTLERWIDEGITYLDNHMEESVFYTMSGDSVVLVTREDEGCDTYEVHVLKRVMCGHTER
jgi:hypothetical protein